MHYIKAVGKPGIWRVDGNGYDSLKGWGDYVAADRPDFEVVPAGQLGDPAKEFKGKVLVLIPTLARPVMCRRAVESLLRQEFASWDLGIVKNGGDKFPSEYESQLSAALEHPRIRMLVTPQKGLGNALNIGLSHFRTDAHKYFANLEDDDEWDPDFLRRMYQEAQKSGADVVHCLQKQSPYQRQSNGGAMDAGAIRGRNWINFPMCLFRTSLVERVGPFCNEAGPATDWDWHLRCLQVAARYEFVSEALVTHHWHRDNYCLRASGTGFIQGRIKQGVYG